MRFYGYLSKKAWLVLSLVLLSCSHFNEKHSESLYQAPPSTSTSQSQYVAQAHHGMIAAAHESASEAGLAILKKGGNAIDAAVATSFAISVVRPQSTGIGGGGFLLLYRPDQKKTQAYDFRERAPLKAHRDMFLDRKGNPKDFVFQDQTIPQASLNGHLSAGTPGLVHGLVSLHTKYGRLPLKVVMEPAIELANQGFLVYESLAESLESRKDVLSKFPATKAIFFKDGRPLKTGERLIQKDLAWTLEQVSRYGSKAFYEGEIAKRLIREMKVGGGLITSEDLKRYQTIEREPLVGTYRGFEIHTMPPPSSGGVHIIQMLNILEGFDLGELGYGTAPYYNLLIEAMRHAYADRARYLGDPDFVDVPTKHLISKEYAEKVRAQLTVGKAGDSRQVSSQAALPYESPSTTHLTVVDRDGWVVTSTQTVNYIMGSGVVVPGTGILLNDEMDDFSIKPGVPNAYGLLGNQANQIEPGKTMLSSMTPTILFQDGYPFLALGSPGGSRIINAVLQVIIHRLDFKMSLAEAVHSFRIHHQWMPEKVWFENPNINSKISQELNRMGYQLEPSPFPIGDVQAIGIEKSGKFIGVSDTRSEGQPKGF